MVAFRSNSENIQNTSSMKNFIPMIDNYLGIETEQDLVLTIDDNSPPKVTFDIDSTNKAVRAQTLDISQDNYLSPTKMGNTFQWIPNAYGNKGADVKSNY